MTTIRCDHCGYDCPLNCDRCHHCGWPLSGFPNVRAAKANSEVAALEKRYQAALRAADKRGAKDTIQAFEAACLQSKAVLARGVAEVMRLAHSDLEMYATYYNATSGKFKVPSGSRWDVIRVLTDAALFPGYKQEIR